MTFFCDSTDLILVVIRLLMLERWGDKAAKLMLLAKVNFRGRPELVAGKCSCSPGLSSAPRILVHLLPALKLAFHRWFLSPFRKSLNVVCNRSYPPLLLSFLFYCFWDSIILIRNAWNQKCFKCYSSSDLEIFIQTLPGEHPSENHSFEICCTLQQ